MIAAISSAAIVPLRVAPHIADDKMVNDEESLRDLLLRAGEAKDESGALMLSALKALTEFLIQHQRLGEARDAAEQALALAERGCGEDSLPVADALRRLARVEYLSQCALPGAPRDNVNVIGYLERSLRISEAGRDTDGVVDAIRLLSTVLRQAGRAADAEHLARRAVDLERHRYGLAHSKTAQAQWRLVRILLFAETDGTGRDLDDDERRRGEALAILAAIVDAMRPALVRGDASDEEAQVFILAADNRAGLLHRVGQFDEAIDDLRLAVSNDSLKYGPESTLPGPASRRELLETLTRQAGRSRA